MSASQKFTIAAPLMALVAGFDFAAGDYICGALFSIAAIMDVAVAAFWRKTTALHP